MRGAPERMKTRPSSTPWLSLRLCRSTKVNGCVGRVRAWPGVRWLACCREQQGAHSRRRGGASVTTYVSLFNWTEQGIKNFRDTAPRAEEFTKLVQSSGGRVRELLWTVGEYDIVCVADFPDDKAGVAALLRLGSAGNIRSKTLRAFDSDQMAGIIGRAG